MAVDIDSIALDVARRFTEESDPQRRASLQVAVVEAIRTVRTQPAELAEQQRAALPRPLEELRDAAQHALDCADGGDDYACGQPMIEALTTLGIMEKTGRGLWSTNVQIARSVVDALAATGKQQVGEVQGDALAGLAEACEDMRAASEECDNGEGLAHAVPFHQWNDFLSKLDHAVQALAARQPGAQGPVDGDWHLRGYAYASKQATTCAGCGKHKHTPLRIDAMGGYVCLTCIDQKLGALLGEFGYPPAQGIDLGQFRPVVLDRRMEAVADGKHDAVHECDRLLALIDQRDAAPGVVNG